jgi:hypothetical protein
VGRAGARQELRPRLPAAEAAGPGLIAKLFQLPAADAQAKMHLTGQTGSE